METRQLRDWLLIEEEIELHNLLTGSCLSNYEYDFVLLNHYFIVLNIPEDHYSSVLNTISTFYLDKKLISTLFPLFDHYLNGGLLFLLYVKDQDYQAAIEQAGRLRMRWEGLRKSARELKQPSSISILTLSHTPVSSSVAFQPSSVSTSTIMEAEENHVVSPALSSSNSLSSSHQENGVVREEEFRYFAPLPRSRLMTREQWYTLLPSLPRSLARHSPTLLYTSYEDGYCLDSLLPRVRRKSPTLLLVELPEDVMVGIYREDEWEDSETAFGKSSTRLLRKRKGERACEMWEGVKGEEGGARFVYLRSTKDCILVGAGGKEGIALCISNDFSKSYSQRSEVFGNPALFRKEFFPILNIEAFYLL